MKNNKKGFALVPMMIMLLIFITFIFLVVKYKHHASIIKTEQAYQSLISWIDSWKQDLLIKNAEWKRISNPKLENLGKETYDDGVDNLFNIIEWVSKTEGDNSNELQYLDKLITNKTPALSILTWKNAPSKRNNVFEIDLIDFIDNDWNFVWNLHNMTINWGTSNENTPDFYILLWRIKKNATINLDNNYLINLSKIQAWQGWNQYWNSWTDLDNFAFDYVRIPGSWWSCTTGSPDFDLWINWCKKASINDFLSNNDFDLNNYFYKMYLVFWIKDNNLSNVPFKLTSSDWIFGLWNITNLDVTILTPNNTKRRVILKVSNKNNILPYLVYSLWVKWQIHLDWNDS